MTFAQDVAVSEAALAAQLADSAEGVVVDADWPALLVKVNRHGGEQWMRWVGEAPWEGDRVRVVEAAGTRFCMAVYGAPMGSFVSVAANIATVTGDDGVTYRYPYPSGSAFSPGQRLLLDHAHRAVVMRYSAEPAGSEYSTPAPPPESGVQSRTFFPIDSGNYRNGAFAGQLVEISVSRSAAYWYGTQIADTIPDSATILAARISLVENWDEVPGTATQMGTHTQPTRGSEPAISGTINVTGPGAHDISAFATALKTGAAYGIGFRKNTGWRQFASFTSSGEIGRAHV